MKSGQNVWPILRGSIILDHMTPQAGGGKDIELDKLMSILHNLEQTLIMKNTDVRTGVLNTKQYYDEFVEQSNNSSLKSLQNKPDL